MARLYQAARILRGIEGQGELARLLNASPQTVNNWETRGISIEGLIKAQEVVGCNAVWLRDGSGEMEMGAAAQTATFQDVALLVTLYGRADAQGREQILRFARSVVPASSGAKGKAANS